MTISFKGREVARPTNAEVRVRRSLSGALLDISVSFQLNSWPWNNMGPITILGLPSQVEREFQNSWQLLGIATTTSEQMTLSPARHESSGVLQFTLNMSTESFISLTKSDPSSSIWLKIFLSLLPVGIERAEDAEHGIYTRVQIVQFTFEVSAERWAAVVRNAGIEEEANSLLRKEAESEALLQSLQDRARDSEQIIKTIRKDAAEFAVSEQSSFFAHEAMFHEKSSRKWLYATCVLTVVLVVCAGSSIWLKNSPSLSSSTALDLLHLAIGKAVIFATLTYAVVLSSKNYMAHRHNWVTNKHRQNSLATYRALVAAAGDQANRDIVLNRAAESVFGVQPSGFSKNDTADGKMFSLINLSSGINRDS